MNPAMIGAISSNPLVQNIGKNIAGQASDKITSGALGGIGKLIGGKKGQRIGKSVAKGMSSVRKSIFGFESGGKIRRVPMVVTGYNAGGVIAKPMIRPLPRPRPRKRK